MESTRDGHVGEGMLYNNQNADINLCSVVKRHTAGPEIFTAEARYYPDTLSRVRVKSYSQIIAEINYQGDAVNQLLFLLDNTKDTAATFKMLRVFLQYIIGNRYRWGWKESNSPYKKQYETIIRVYQKMQDGITIDSNYRYKLLSEAKNAIRSIDSGELNTLMQEMTKEATLEFEQRVRYDTTLRQEVRKILDFLEHFTLRIVINAPSPVVVDKDAHVVKLDLFAFLSYRAGSGSSGKELPKQQKERSEIVHKSDQIMDNVLLPALRSITAGIVIDNVLKDSEHTIPRDMLIDAVLIFLEEKYISEIPSYKKDDRNRYFSQLKFYGADSYVTLIRQLGRLKTLDEKIARIYYYLSKNFNLQERYHLSRGELPSCETLQQFVKENIEELQKIEQVDLVLGRRRVVPQDTSTAILVPTTQKGSSVIEVKHLDVKEEIEEYEVAETVCAYELPEQQGAKADDTVFAVNQHGYFSQETIEYVTPNLGQGHYIDRINELIPLLSEGERGDKLRVFLGSIFSLYLVARADHSDGEELNKIVLKALLETTRDDDFKEAIESLMNKTDEPAIRKIATSLRNSEYLKKYGIYLGVDLVSVREGKNGERVVNVLYARVHEINKIEAVNVYNRNRKDGEGLPIYYLGKRIDNLDRNMRAFGFTWNGDIFGAVVDRTVKEFVYNTLLPILQNKPYDKLNVHPVSNAIRAVVKRDLSGNNESEIIRKIEQAVAFHELQHTVDELLGRITTSVDTEKSAFLAGIALSECPYVALVMLLQLYLNPFLGFNIDYARAVSSDVKDLKKALGVADTGGDIKDEVNAILEKALELKNGELSHLASELHKELFGANALSRLEPYGEEEAISTATSTEPDVPQAETTVWQPEDSSEPFLSLKRFRYIVRNVLVIGLFVGALLFTPEIRSPATSSLSHLQSTVTNPISPSDLGIYILPTGEIGIKITKGGNLTSIGEKYYGNASPEIAKKIAELNGISDLDKIDAGTELRLPHHIVHIVQEGETFSGIAYLYNTRERVLRNMNAYFCSMRQYGDNNENILLRPGDKIVIVVRESITKIIETKPVKIGELILPNESINSSI